MTKPLFLTAVGDIAFAGRNIDNPSEHAFASISPFFTSSEIVCANLENPLISKGVPVKSKCVLSGAPGWAEILKKAGINLVSLANNHMMDFGEQGLRSTIDSLKRSGICYVGAGENVTTACAPKYIDTSHGRVAVLARTAVDVSSPSYATATRPGVAFLNEEETYSSIRQCSNNSDITIIMIHWGVEEYMYPTPQQRVLAQKLFDNGVDIIIGHHPHVLQGIETIEQKLVAYSLGNFLFDEFEWSADFNEKEMSFFSPLTKNNRESVILQIDLDQKRRITYTTVHTEISSDAKQVIANEPHRAKDLAKLSRRLNIKPYGLFWNCYAFTQELRLRFMPQKGMKHIITNIHKIRLRHIIDILKKIKRAVRLITGKTTNPYE